MKYNKTEYFCMGLAAIVYYPLKLVVGLAVCPIAAVGKYAKEHDSDFRDSERPNWLEKYY